MKTFLKNNALALSSLVVAASSLSIAALSLHFTIASQTTDREYKEMMIRPSVDIGADTDTFSVWIRNNGLGPAVIKRVVLQFDKNCIDSDSFAKNAFTDYQNKFKLAVGGYMFRGMAMNMDESPHRLPDYTIFILPADLILRSNETQPLFKFDPIAVATYRKTLDKLGGKYPQQFMDNFAEKAFRFPIHIDYCSLSGKYCRFGASEAQPCSAKQ
jgi:hypothetical protein